MTRLATQEEIVIMSEVATGYKVFNNDWTAHDDYAYMVDGVVEGLVHIADGELVPCKNGLHFCEEALDCLKFYGPMRWNKFAKVTALGEVVNGDGGKSAARALRIDEVLDWDSFVDACKCSGNGHDIRNSIGISRGHGISGGIGISNSRGISHGYGIRNSSGIRCGCGIDNSYSISHGYGIRNSSGIRCGCGIDNSYSISGGYGISNGSGIRCGYGISGGVGISDSYGVRYGYGISDGYGISGGVGIRNGSGISGGYGISNSVGVNESVFCAWCAGISMCIFAYQTTGRLLAFNKPVSRERFGEVWREIHDARGDWYPKFNNALNLYEDAGRRWECVPAPNIEARTAAEAYADMPEELEAYIKAMPEYDAEIYQKVTGRK